MDYSTKNICGYTAVCQFDEPVLICQSLTTAQTICKLMEEDAKGNVHRLCYVDIEELYNERKANTARANANKEF